MIIKPDQTLESADWLKVIGCVEPLASAETEADLAKVTGYVGREAEMRRMPFYQGWLVKRRSKAGG